MGIISFLMLGGAPAMAADSTGAGTYVGKVVNTQASITFKDVYAFRAVGSRGPEIVLYLTDKPMDKKAITAALRKERKASVLLFGPYLDGMAKAKLEIRGGEVTYLYLFAPPGSNLNLGGSEIESLGKLELKVNNDKRIEGRFFTDGAVKPGAPGKIDLRFATDLADVGPGKPGEN